MTQVLPTRAADADPAPAGPVSVRRATTCLSAILVVAVVASLLVGSRMVAPSALLDGAAAGHAILEARIPRTVLGLVVGAALAVAGACLQGMTRNPLADPGLLGINSGASLAMVVALSVFGVGSLHLQIGFAFVGAALAALLVHGVAAVGRRGATPAKLIIAGAAVAAGAVSWTSGILLTDQQTLEVFRRWQVGTIGGRGWDVLVVGLPFLTVGALLALAGARTLDALALGDDLARGMGLKVTRDRAVIGVGIILLTGTATALAGPIAFVGLVVPHAVRALAGGAYGRVLPLSAGLGAALVLCADVVGRIVLPPTEVQVGIMTAVVGVPVFAWFLRRGRVGAL